MKCYINSMNCQISYTDRMQLIIFFAVLLLTIATGTSAPIPKPVSRTNCTGDYSCASIECSQGDGSICCPVGQMASCTCYVWGAPNCVCRSLNSDVRAACLDIVCTYDSGRICCPVLKMAKCQCLSTGDSFCYCL